MREQEFRRLESMVLDHEQAASEFWIQSTKSMDDLRGMVTQLTNSVWQLTAIVMGIEVEARPQDQAELPKEDQPQMAISWIRLHVPSEDEEGKELDIIDLASFVEENEVGVSSIKISEAPIAVENLEGTPCGSQFSFFEQTSTIQGVGERILCPLRNANENESGIILVVLEMKNSQEGVKARVYRLHKHYFNVFNDLENLEAAGKQTKLWLFWIERKLKETVLYAIKDEWERGGQALCGAVTSVRVKGLQWNEAIAILACKMVRLRCGNWFIKGTLLLLRCCFASPLLFLTMILGNSFMIYSFASLIYTLGTRLFRRRGKCYEPGTQMHNQHNRKGNRKGLNCNCLEF